MLAEAAHSAADSVNEVFLAIGLHRDRKPADATHPLGHGRERFLWAFMAAIASFLIGGCLSIALAIAHLRAPRPVEVGATAWIVLAIAFVADGVSWLQSIRQARRQAKEYGISLWLYLVRSSDPGKEARPASAISFSEPNFEWGAGRFRGRSERRPRGGDRRESGFRGGPSRRRRGWFFGTFALKDGRRAPERATLGANSTANLVSRRTLDFTIGWQVGESQACGKDPPNERRGVPHGEDRSPQDGR